MAAFGDLLPDVVTARVTTSYGKAIDVPMLMLSWEQWEQIGRDVPPPAVPLTKAAASGKPEDMLPNPQDAVYLERKAAADDERTARRLLAALEGGGMTVPGNTVREKTAAIKSMDAGLLTALVGVLAKAYFGANARLDARAETFRADTDAQIKATDVPAVGVSA